MKAYIQTLIGADIDPYQKYSVLYYMSGAVPQTIADVKAAVDLSDMSDLHSKCVGTTMITATVGNTQASGGQKNITFYNSNSNTLTCLKGGAFATTSGWVMCGQWPLASSQCSVPWRSCDTRYSVAVGGT